MLSVEITTDDEAVCVETVSLEVDDLIVELRVGWTEEILTVEIFEELNMDGIVWEVVNPLGVVSVEEEVLKTGLDVLDVEEALEVPLFIDEVAAIEDESVKNFSIEFWLDENFEVSILEEYVSIVLCVNEEANFEELTVFDATTDDGVSEEIKVVGTEKEVNGHQVVNSVTTPMVVTVAVDNVAV